MYDFSMALHCLKAGVLMARRGWNGKGMFVYLVKGSKFSVSRPPLNTIFHDGMEIDYRPHLDMRTADGSCVPWVASQSDLLAEDWMQVDSNGEEVKELEV